MFEQRAADAHSVCVPVVPSQTVVVDVALAARVGAVPDHFLGPAVAVEKQWRI